MLSHTPRIAHALLYFASCATLGSIVALAAVVSSIDAPIPTCCDLELHGQVLIALMM
jgi:hypothetical protein